MPDTPSITPDTFDFLTKLTSGLTINPTNFLLIAPEAWKGSLPPELSDPLINLANDVKGFLDEKIAQWMANAIGVALAWIQKSADGGGYLLGRWSNAQEAGRAQYNRERPITLLDIDTLAQLVNTRQMTLATARDDVAGNGLTTDRFEAYRNARQSVLTGPDLLELLRRGDIGDTGFQQLAELNALPDAHIAQLKKLRYRLAEPTTLLSYWLRHDKSGIDIDNKLSQHGFTEEQIKIIKELADYIPPIPDLIRMAVREAFSPQQIQELDLDKEFPEEFAKWAARQGVSREWSLRYWEAHWELPSTFQAIEMFQRQLITREQLEALLKAQDIAPKWRDKFLGISYNLPTRVDTRRMYEKGIIDADRVEQIYLHSGYSPDDAKALRNFVVADVFESTVSPIRARLLSLFREGIVDETELRNFLKDLQMPDDQIDRFIAAEKFLAEEEHTKRILNAVKKQYLAYRIDEAVVSARLVAAGMSVIAVGRTLQFWYEERQSRITRLSVRDIHEALKGAIIDDKKAKKLLKERGMSDEEVDIFIQLDIVQPEPEEGTTTTPEGN